MSEGLPLREEVPKETWDLKDLFTSDHILSNIGTSSTNVFRF